jgi:asparagine synthase (glutamine-hydrolysing)
MCGICGVVGGDPRRERDRVSLMVSLLAHRGPDGVGIHVDQGAVVGNTRLAVIDPEGGDQPLSTGDGERWITFNGEIYNHAALRRSLELRGHRFRTRSDTEVVLRLFEEHGAEGLGLLRGMFAFAVWEPRTGRLFAARDPFGQKPFHYAEAEGRFFFASEIKALLAHPSVPVAPAMDAVGYYLAHRFVPAPLTMFEGVRKLPPGHWLEWQDGSLRIERYWRPDFSTEVRMSDDDWIEGLRDQLDRAVRNHLVSDVPVGALLSGGLDSSAVVASFAAVADRPIPTFAVGSDVERLDERESARMVATHFGTLHHESVASSELLSRVPELVRTLDEPSDPIAACTHEAARLAASRVKVALGGDGGDEIFGGFDRYLAFPWAERYGALPRRVREGLLRPVIRSLPGALAYKSLGQKARWLDTLEGARGGELYASMSTAFRFGPAVRGEVYGPALKEALGWSRPLAGNGGGTLRPPEVDPVRELVARTWREAPGRDPLHRMLYTDMVTRLPEHSLLLADRLSMAHGLELRSPLLDLDLAEFCARMPSRLKARGTRTKVALRAAVRDRLPAPIVERRKQGFMLPVAYWMQDGAADALRRALTTGPLAAEGWIDPEGVTRMVTEHAARSEDHHVRLWMLLNLDAWFRIYIRGEREWPEEPSLLPAGAAG